LQTFTRKVFQFSATSPRIPSKLTIRFQPCSKPLILRDLDLLSRRRHLRSCYSSIKSHIFQHAIPENHVHIELALVKQTLRTVQYHQVQTLPTPFLSREHVSPRPQLDFVISDPVLTRHKMPHPKTIFETLSLGPFDQGKMETEPALVASSCLLASLSLLGTWNGGQRQMV
jgi:hypothetical protein